MFAKSFDAILNSILIRYPSDIDTSVGSLAWIRSSAFAAVLWAKYKMLDFIYRQIWPESMTRRNLERYAVQRGLTLVPGESDSSLLSRVQTRDRMPPAGGNKYDYVQWTKEVFVTDGTVHNPSPAMLSHSGIETFSADYALDGNVSSVAWDLDGVSVGSTILVNLGANKGRNYVGLGIRLYANGPAVQYKVQYSADAILWADASDATMVAGQGWNWIEWATKGIHQYWRLYVVSNEGIGHVVTEIQFKTGAEIVVDARCYPRARGDGTTDVLPIGNLQKGRVSDTLLAAVQAKIEDKGTSGLPADALLARAPTISVQNVQIDADGPVDAALAIANISAYLDSMSPGQTLYKAQLVTITQLAGSTNAVAISPANDVTVDQYTIIRSGSVEIV